MGGDYCAGSDDMGFLRESGKRRNIFHHEGTKDTKKKEKEEKKIILTG